MDNIKTIGNSRYSIEQDKEGLWYIKEVYDDGVAFAFSSIGHVKDRKELEEKFRKLDKEGIVIFGGVSLSCKWKQEKKKEETPEETEERENE